MASRFSQIFTLRDPHDDQPTSRKNFSISLSTTKQKRRSITSLLVTLFKSSSPSSISSTSQTPKLSKLNKRKSHLSRRGNEPVFVPPWIGIDHPTSICSSSLPRLSGRSLSNQTYSTTQTCLTKPTNGILEDE